jgi:hypothetical protein
VKIQLRAGALNSSGMRTMPPNAFTPRALDQLQAQGYHSPVVAVEVANVGRQPVTVAKGTTIVRAHPWSEVINHADRHKTRP